MNKKFIKREIKLIHWFFLTTAKLLIGVGIGLAIATNFYYVQPYWYIMVLMGAIILVGVLYRLSLSEEKEQLILESDLRKIRRMKRR